MKRMSDLGVHHLHVPLANLVLQLCKCGAEVNLWWSMQHSCNQSLNDWCQSWSGKATCEATRRQVSPGWRHSVDFKFLIIRTRAILDLGQCILRSTANSLIATNILNSVMHEEYFRELFWRILSEEIWVISSSPRTTRQKTTSLQKRSSWKMLNTAEPLTLLWKVDQDFLSVA